MTNIEKVKRILDAGHWVKVIGSSRNGYKTLTSYNKDEFSYIEDDIMNLCKTNKQSFQDCTIEVIPRIPTAYVAWDKVLVLSNPRPDNSMMDEFVWKVCEVSSVGWSEIYVSYKDYGRYFPYHCLSPAFEEDSLSGKEAKVTIDGKEYSVTLKLI